MIQVKKIKVLTFCMTVSLLLGGCSSKHKPIEIDAGRQEESQISTAAAAAMPEQTPQNQEAGSLNGGNEAGADGGYARGTRIEEQTFDVTLNPLGQVTFASYKPDTSGNALADVAFQIEKDGQVLSRLPGTSEDNVGNERFNQVEAVSFPDYNNDGYDDIIIIISYDFGAAPHSVIRYYKGTAEGNFVYERQMSENATSALGVITIQSAKDFIGPKGGSTEEGTADEAAKTSMSLESWQQAFIEYLNNDSDAEGQRGYTLINMNADRIPQLVEVGWDAATGCRIIHYGKGKAQVTQLNRLYFDYIPGVNLLRNSEGLMDYYYDLIYSIVDGEMKLIASGYYGAEDNSNVQFDAEGNPVYRYEWNGVQMDREEYERELSKAYDAQKAVSYDYNNLYSLDEIKKMIEGYQG